MRAVGSFSGLGTLVRADAVFTRTGGPGMDCHAHLEQTLISS
jgi:hypothetical protein